MSVPLEHRQIGRYEIREELGHGGMATVYRAWDPRLERDVALKVLHPHLRAAGEARRRFTREAKAVAKLRHPYILEIYDSSPEESEFAFIAAELLTGPTLKEFGAQHDEIPAEIAAAMALGVAEALSAAHAAGIVHRDVKPENVMLHEQRTLKLTDFGIAQLHDTQSFTATGQILGSPGHMAPEQVETGEVDERSDIFALGTVLYYLACGRLPFTGRNPHQVLRRVMDAEYTAPLRVRPSIGAPLAAIIERCLAREPRERFESAKALALALRECCASVGVDDPEAALTRYLQDPDREAEALRSGAVAKLIESGSARVRARDVPGAMDAFNRVLALDEGNEEALAQLSSLGDPEGSGLKRFVLPLMLIGGLVLAMGLGLAYDRGRAADPGLATPSTADAGAAPSTANDRDAGNVIAAGDGEAERDAGPSPAPSPDAGVVASAAGRSPSRGTNPRPSGGPRSVVFRPSPQNVEIGVDGGPLRPFGPSFRSVNLEPGRHTFRVRAATSCCEERTFTRDIPAGEGAHAVALQLAFRAARLYVGTNAPGDVSVSRGAGAAARGRTRQFIPVPMTQAADTRSVAISAPGHERQVVQVRLRAGELEERFVELTPTPATPPPSPPAPDPE